MDGWGISAHDLQGSCSQLAHEIAFVAPLNSQAHQATAARTWTAMHRHASPCIASMPNVRPSVRARKGSPTPPARCAQAVGSWCARPYRCGPLSVHSPSTLRAGARPGSQRGTAHPEGRASEGHPAGGLRSHEAWYAGEGEGNGEGGGTVGTHGNTWEHMGT